MIRKQRIILVSVLLFIFFPHNLYAAAPPQQSAHGPGGSEYLYAKVIKNLFDAGKPELQYWIFEPSEPKPQGPLPLVIFNHGWSGTNPKIYGAWIEHIVR